MPKLLHYLLISKDYKDRLLHVGESGGSTRQALTKAQLQDFWIEYPESLGEQQRIVSILDEAFEDIAKASANVENAASKVDGVFASYLNAAIEGGISFQSGDDTATDLLERIRKARDAAIREGKAKAEKESTERPAVVKNGVPKGWSLVQLESITTVIADGVHKTPRYTAAGVPFVTVKNLTAGPGISFNDLNYISREDHAEFIKRTYPEKGDILITKDGTIGVVRLVDTDVEFSIFVSVALIKPALKELGPYLSYALSSTKLQSNLVPQGTALKHIYLVDLRRLLVPLPPLSIQRQTVARLDELKAETLRLKGIFESKKAALDALKGSLLHEAFAGDL